MLAQLISIIRRTTDYWTLDSIKRHTGGSGEDTLPGTGQVHTEFVTAIKKAANPRLQILAEPSRERRVR